MYVYMYTYILCMDDCMQVCMLECTHVCMYASMHTCAYMTLCFYKCMYVMRIDSGSALSLGVHMYVKMYVCIYVFVYTRGNRQVAFQVPLDF